MENKDPFADSDDEDDVKPKKSDATTINLDDSDEELPLSKPKLSTTPVTFTQGKPTETFSPFDDDDDEDQPKARPSSKAPVDLL